MQGVSARGDGKGKGERRTGNGGGEITTNGGVTVLGGVTTTGRGALQHGTRRASDSSTRNGIVTVL